MKVVVPRSHRLSSIPGVYRGVYCPAYAAAYTDGAAQPRREVFHEAESRGDSWPDSRIGWIWRRWGPPLADRPLRPGSVLCTCDFRTVHRDLRPGGRRGWNDLAKRTGGGTTATMLIAINGQESNTVLIQIK